MKLFEQQKAAYKFSTQFGAAVAGVQSGKTILGCIWAGKKITEFPTENGLIVAPTHNILRAATLQKFFMMWPEARAYYKEQKGEITLPEGATIFIRSADNPLGIEGISPKWWWLDEGGMTSKLTWIVLRSRVSMTGGQGFITTTPYNMGWLYTDFYVPWKDKIDPQLSFFTWKSVDSPYFSKEFYDAESKRLSPEEFARRYMGEFKKMSGLVWDLPESQIIAPIENLISKAEARIIGVDWGFRNPSAIIVLYLYDKVWYIVDEWKRPEKVTSEVIQILQNKVKEHRITKIYGDPSAPDKIEECRRAGLPMYEADNDILAGIGTVRNLIYEKRFFVYNTCTLLLDEISGYHYPEKKDDNKEAKELPEKFNDHLCDAARYPIHSYQPAKIIFNIASPTVKNYPEIGL